MRKGFGVGGMIFWFVVGCLATLIVGCVIVYLILRQRDRQVALDLSRSESNFKAESERRQTAENELRGKETFYESLVNNSHDMVFVYGVNAEGLPDVFVKVNDVACQRLGYTRDKLLTLTPLDVMEPDSTGGGRGYSRSDLVVLSDAAVIERENAFARVHTGQILERRHMVFQRIYVAADGTRIPAEITAARCDVWGKPLIVCSAHDMTRQLATERALQESELRLRNFFSYSPIGVAMYDAHKRLVSVNQACLRMLGIPDQQEFARFDLLGNPFIPSEQKESILKGHSVHFETCIDFDEVRHVFTLVTGRRGKVHLEIFVNDMGRDEHYNVNGHVIQVMDVTERKEIEQALRESEKQRRQAQKMEVMGTLAGGIAHDFNNILTPILGYSEMVLHMLPETDPMREFIQEVSKASYRARDLVAQILSFSRQADPEPKPLHLTPIVKEALNLVRASAPASITINRTIKIEEDIVMGDPTQIHQVVMNLCTNAVHAMRGKDSGVLDVRVTDFVINPYARTEFTELVPGRYIRLSIKDTGSGMDKNTLARIFEPFFTTKPVGEGTGMGLSVVKGIISGMKGAMRVETEVGSGSVFHIVLPAIEMEAVPLMHASTVMPGGHENVLFVDDDPDIVRMGEHMLKTLGYTPYVVGHAAAALRLLDFEPNKFDVAITDQAMSGMTGLELTREILARKPNLPVILCTSFTDAAMRQAAEAAGICEFIPKPIMMRDLANAIRRALQKKSSGDSDQGVKS